MFLNPYQFYTNNKGRLKVITMPLPTAKLKGKSKEKQRKYIGKVFHFLKKESPKMKHKQRVAIALSQARKMGADIPKKQENYMNNTTKLREFVRSNIDLWEMKELKKDLRQDMEEMTVSSNIDIGSVDKIPGGESFKKDNLPGERDDSEHGVDEIEVDGTEDTDDEERTGYTGTQAGNADKSSEVEEEVDLDEDKLIETLDNMSEEELDEYIGSLNEDEVEYIESLIQEREEVMPDEIDASNPPEVGSEDENDGMKSVDDELEDGQEKKHTAKQVETD